LEQLEQETTPTAASMNHHHPRHGPDDGDEEEEEEGGSDAPDCSPSKEIDLNLATPTNDKENGDRGSTPSNSHHHQIGEEDDDVIEEDDSTLQEPTSKDPVVLAQLELIRTTVPQTALEIALTAALERKQFHVERLTLEIAKLQKFVSKRKQTYKRKRKDDGAPTRALSAYNLFIKERFAQLAKENEHALKSDDLDAKLIRVPPANLVTKTGNEWKTLSNEVKAKYEVRAKSDKQRYDKEMREYQRPDGYVNRKRSKTGYNTFFSAHVVRLKQSESGVPSERGSVARLVGTAWKQLGAEDKAYYEREADKHNTQQEKEGDDNDPQQQNEHQHHQLQQHDDEMKRQQQAQVQLQHQQQQQQQQQQHHMEYNPMVHHPDLHNMPLPGVHHPQHHPMHSGMHHDLRQQQQQQQPPQPPPPAQHLHYYSQPPPAGVYGPPPPYFDYSQHHQRQHHHHQAAMAQGYQPQNYPPQQPRHYDG
jgi:HMG (high mobility group) box/HMG-box domain